MGHQNFDDFIKNKVETREYEFKDAYWLDAVDLIEKDDRRKKRGFFFLLFGAFLLIGGFASGIYMANAQTISPIAETTLSTPKENLNSNTATEIDPTTSINTPNNNTNTELTTDNNNPTNRLQDKTSTSKEIKEFSPNPEKRLSNKTNQLAADSESSLLVQTITDITTVNRDQNNTERPEKNTTNIPLNSNSVDKNSFAEADNNTNIISEITPSDEISLPKKQTTEAFPKPNRRPWLNPIQHLDNVLLPISKPSLDVIVASDMPELSIEKSEDKKIPEDENKKDPSKLSVGVRGSALFFLSPADFAKSGIGAAGGATLEYSINPRLSISLDALYHIRNHSFSPLNASELVEYSFGRLESIRYLTPLSVHSFEFPIYLSIGLDNPIKKGANLNDQNRFSKHRIEVGIAPIAQYGIRGKIEYIPSEGQESEIGWVETDAFKKLHFNGLVGYQYQMNRSFAIGLRARYALGGIINKDFILPPGVVLEEPEKLYFSITGKITIF